MAVRLKTRWHRSKRSRRNIEGSRQPKTVEDLAGAVAFNVWKIAKDVLDNMHKEEFKIVDDRQAMAILIELVAFLIQICDRAVYGYLSDEERGSFINALARHLADTVQTNQAEALRSGDYVAPFVATLNTRFADYAECSYGEDGPGYAFRRYLAERISETLASSDNKWVLEQVIDVESPKAAQAVMRVVTDVVGLRARKAEAPQEQ